MKTPAAIVAAIAVLVLAGCSSPAPTHNTSAASPTPASTATIATNTWAAPGSVVVTALPLGDGHLSTTTASVGTLFACQAGDPNGPGAPVVGPWIHGSTWNLSEKVVVQGDVKWPTAKFTVNVSGSQRIITTNDLPVGFGTGTFPIATNDPAAQYDRNPNSISSSQSVTLTLPTAPKASASPNCLNGGAIGVLLNGVLLYNAVDAQGRDAVAHEEQDLCQGHPQQQGQYHYHEVPTCLRDNATGSSTVVGWANDGYPIVVERDTAGNLPNNGDLDACHGRTSPVGIDGAVTTTFHYDATLEFPYTIGCFHGTSTVRGGP